MECLSSPILARSGIFFRLVSLSNLVIALTPCSKIPDMADNAILHKGPQMINHLDHLWPPVRL